MGKKIDLTKTESAQLTDNTSAEVIAGTKRDDLKYLKSLGARALPLDPSAAGWDPSSIQKQLYKQSEILFAWLKKLAASQKDLGTAIDDYLYAVSIGKETPKVYSTLALANADFGKSLINSGSLVFVNTGADLSCYYAGTSLVQIGQSLVTALNRVTVNEGDISSLKTRMGTAETDISNNKTEEAKHVHIKLDNSKVPYAEYPSSSGIASTDNLMTRADGNNIVKSVDRVVAALGIYYSLSDTNKQQIKDILNGTSKVSNSKNADVATYDSSGKKINVSKYGSKVTLTYVQSTGVMTAHLFNQDDLEISSANYNLPTELIFDNQGYDASTKKLWFHPVGNAAGVNVEIDVTDLFDVYTGDTTDACISVSVTNNKITATIKDGSISLDKMSSTFQSTWDSWTTAEATRASNETTRQNQEATRQSNELTRQANEDERLANYNLYKNSYGKVCLNYSALKTH